MQVFALLKILKRSYVTRNGFDEEGKSPELRPLNPKDLVQAYNIFLATA
jgi:hypothetical protein